MLGAIIGDIVGSRFEFGPAPEKDFELFTDECSYTDDTICTVAIADAILSGRSYKMLCWIGVIVILLRWVGMAICFTIGCTKTIRNLRIRLEMVLHVCQPSGVAFPRLGGSDSGSQEDGGDFAQPRRRYKGRTVCSRSDLLVAAHALYQARCRTKG